MTITKRLLSSTASLKISKRAPANHSSASSSSNSSSAAANHHHPAHTSTKYKYTRFPRILSVEPVYESTSYLTPIQHTNPLSSINAMKLKENADKTNDDYYDSLYSASGTTSGTTNSTASTASKANSLVNGTRMSANYLKNEKRKNSKLAYDMFFNAYRPLNNVFSSGSSVRAGSTANQESVFQQLYESVNAPPVHKTISSAPKLAIPEDGKYSAQFETTLKGQDNQGGIKTIGLQSHYKYSSRVPKELMISINKKMIPMVGVVSAMFMECDKNWINTITTSAMGRATDYCSCMNDSAKKNGKAVSLVNHSFRPYSLEREVLNLNNTITNETSTNKVNACGVSDCKLTSHKKITTQNSNANKISNIIGSKQ
ncbi:hypothetical protein ACO0QE_001547 [Hanseniaspora vineae]